MTTLLSYRKNDWSSLHAAAAGVLGAAGLAVTWPAWSDLARMALRDEESSHILLVPLVFVGLVYVRRWRFRRLRPTGQWVGPALIAGGWLLHSVGDRWLIQAFWHGGAVVTVVGCLITAVGAQVLYRFLPAFLVLGFLVPVPGLVRQQIALPLQTATARLTEWVFAFFGQEVGRSGNVLTVGTTEIAIAEACNGLRMVFALTLISYAFAFSTPLRPYVRVLVLAASPALAIMANIVRLIPTVWVYGRFSTPTADLFHDLSGWVMLPLAFLILMGVIGLLRWALVPVTRFTLAYD